MITKNNMKYLISLIFFFFQYPVFAENIEVLDLETARIYDPGVIDAITGVFDANLWKGTSTSTAVDLINKIPTTTSSKVGGKLIRATILAGGMPPEGERKKYVSARLRYVMKMQDNDALKTLMKGYSDYVHLPKNRVEYALGSDDIESACDISDNLGNNRSLPYWIKIRVFCNISRDELAAAELAVELLQSMGHEDRLFYEFIDFFLGNSDEIPKITNNIDPLVNAMQSKAINFDTQALITEAKNNKLGLKDKVGLINRLPNQIKYDQIEELLINGIVNDRNIQFKRIPTYNPELLINDSFDKGSSEKLDTIENEDLFSAKILATILNKADTHLSFSLIVKALETHLDNVTSDQIEIPDINIFVRASLERKDYTLLRELYEKLPNGNQKTKIRLIMAILDNTYLFDGFLTNLEASFPDIELQYFLSDRDLFILSSLRVSSSLPFLKAMEGKDEGFGFTVKAGDMLLLKTTLRHSSVAETALRAAIILENSPLNDSSIYNIIDVLISAGLTEFAKDIAIEDFARRL